MKLTILAILQALSILLSSCGPSARNENPGFTPRGAAIYAWEVSNGELGQSLRGEVANTGALEVAVHIDYTVVHPPDDLPMVSRFELDFGEGNGWEDVTSEARNWDYGEIGRGLDVNRLTHHTYSEPGEYLLRGRVTYWDGEVFDTSGRPPNYTTKSDITITILLPEAAP